MSWCARLVAVSADGHEVAEAYGSAAHPFAAVDRAMTELRVTRRALAESWDEPGGVERLLVCVRREEAA